MINYRRTPLYPQRIIGQVTNSLDQLPAFANVYRGLRNFIDNGGLSTFALPWDSNDIARWNSEFRPGVIWIGGQPSEINFFEDLWGMGTPKEIDATNMYISYNSAINNNIYAQSAATGTSGTITGGCYYGDVVNGNYTGAYAVFQIATSQYINNGANSNINIGDGLFIYEDNKWCRVIKKDISTPYAHLVYVVPNDAGYTINIPAQQPMLPMHVQITTGYFNNDTSVPHSEWETPGYVKRIQPLMIKRDYIVAKNTIRAYPEKVTFPLIFDTITGQTLDSWDLKGSQDARNDMVMAANLQFFTGEPMTNTAVTTADFVTGQYGGFDGYMNELFFGGGQIYNFDPSYGFDLDVDYNIITLQNDAQKLSREYLLMCSKKFKRSMESRAQDMFKNNSGAYSFETFQRGVLGALDSTGLKRLGINNYAWGGDSLFIKEVGAWSDSRWIGNKYFTNMGIAMPGYGQVDSNGMATPPVEFWRPMSQQGLQHGWDEVIRDEFKLKNADEYSGSVTNTLMMSVNGIENVFGIMPSF